MDKNESKNRKRLETVAKLLTADYGIKVEPEHAIQATRLHLLTGSPFKKCVEVVVFFHEHIDEFTNNKK